MLALACVLCSGRALADYDDSDKFKAVISANVSHDTNILRLASGYKGGKADTLTDILGTASYKNTWSFQTLSLSLSGDEKHYNHFSNLDYAAWNNSAEWDGGLGYHWTSVLSYSDQRSFPNPAAAATSNVLDLVRTRTINGQLTYIMSSQWSFSGGDSRSVEGHEQSQWINHYTDSPVISATYTTPAGSTLQLGRQRAVVTYTNALVGTGVPAADRGYSEGIDFVTLGLTPTDKTTMSLTYQRVDTQPYPTRLQLPPGEAVSKAGMNLYTAQVTWAATGKTSWTLSQQRVFSVSTYGTGQPTLKETTSLGLFWQITDKVTSNTNMQWLRQDLGSGNASTMLYDFSGSLTYTVAPACLVSLSATLLNNTSQNSLLEYRSNQVSIGVSLRY